ncbi:hypothetical protein [Rubidibacter lacunae]|uniref:hypothetical protein n=1 Tax=Rubidibacter lacunae TaxID=582514 RepID=UPI00042A1BEC|nr:hypothetical protein [Rubidibacter lacunae]
MRVAPGHRVYERVIEFVRHRSGGCCSRRAIARWLLENVHYSDRGLNASKENHRWQGA